MAIQISVFSENNSRYQRLLGRKYAEKKEVLKTVHTIVDAIKAEGDKALFRYIMEFDGVELTPETVRVPIEHIQSAGYQVSEEIQTAIREAIKNLTRFHEQQLSQSYKIEMDDDVVLERRYQPISRVCVSVPNALAPLPSSLYMNGVPARVAGVQDLCMMLAPGNQGISPVILFTADLLNITEIYQISGAQGIAAMAIGTESIQCVDKIVGPGSDYTQTAKKVVFGQVGIDMLAGPSEISIIWNDDTPVRFVALDMLSQSEHGSGMESSVVFCFSQSQAEELVEALNDIHAEFGFSPALEKALDNFGNIFICSTLDEAVSAVNQIAPEHLELLVPDPEAVLNMNIQAGAVFIGSHSPESVGDYYCGTNHVLPTNQTARFSSGLGTMDFVRGFSVIRYTKKALERNGSRIKAIADVEGMKFHGLAVEERCR